MADAEIETHSGDLPLLVPFPPTHFVNEKTWHESKNFGLTKIWEKDRKDHIFSSFFIFPFHGNITFSELSIK